MKLHPFFKSQSLILSATLLVSALATPLAAIDSASDKMDELISVCPWIGLILKNVTYGPITISKLDIAECGRLVFCEPGERIDGTLKYKIDVDQIDSWNLHHVIVGLRKQDAQSCITHSLGVWDKEGHSSFSFNAPAEKGVYEVCFNYYKAVLCVDAFREWQLNPPAHAATIGIVVVE